MHWFISYYWALSSKQFLFFWCIPIMFICWAYFWICIVFLTLNFNHITSFQPNFPNFLWCSDLILRSCFLWYTLIPKDSCYLRCILLILVICWAFACIFWRIIYLLFSLISKIVYIIRAYSFVNVISVELIIEVFLVLLIYLFYQVSSVER